MTTIHSLTNLASQNFIDLPVEAGEDLMTVARKTLFESGLPESVQQGFYVSVYPVEGYHAGTATEGLEHADRGADAGPAATPNQATFEAELVHDPGQGVKA